MTTVKRTVKPEVSQGSKQDVGPELLQDVGQGLLQEVGWGLELGGDEGVDVYWSGLVAR